MSDKHSVLFIGRGATLDGLKRHFLMIQNLEVHHVDTASVEEMKAGRADIVIVEQVGSHENTCAVLEDIGARFPDSILLLHVTEKPAQDLLIHYMNYGTRDIFTNDDNPEQVLRKAIQVLDRKAGAQQGEPARVGKAVVFFASKGGVGKSFLAAASSRILGQSPEFKTILVDLNLQFGDDDLYLNANSSLTIAEMVEEARNNSNRLTDFILDSHIHKVSPSMHLLAAPLSPEKADIITGQDIAGIVKMLKKRYDFIILDTATVLNEVTLTAFDKSDRIFIVIDDEIASVKNAGQTFQLLKKLNHNEDKIDFVINRFNSSYPLSDDLLMKTLTRKPYARIPASEKVGESIHEGYDLVEKKQDDPAVEGVRQFIGKLAQEWNIPLGRSAQKQKNRLFSWFLTTKSSA